MAAVVRRGPAISQMMRPTTGSSRTRRIHRILPPVLAPEPSTFTMAQMSRARTIRPTIPPISRSMIHLPRVADKSRQKRLRQEHVHVVLLERQLGVDTRQVVGGK